MKIKILVFLAILMSCCFVACAKTPVHDDKTDECWNMPDSTVVKQLGTSLTRVLFSPKKVKCYHLLSKQNISEKEIQPVKGFVRDTLLTTLTKSQTAVLQYLLLSNTKSYSEDVVSIEAPYRPVIEFEFISKKKISASVIISISDRSWVIIYDGKEQFKYNYADARLLERFCNYFLSPYYKKTEK